MVPKVGGELPYYDPSNLYFMIFFFFLFSQYSSIKKGRCRGSVGTWKKTSVTAHLKAKNCTVFLSARFACLIVGASVNRVYSRYHYLSHNADCLQTHCQRCLLQRRLLRNDWRTVRCERIKHWNLCLCHSTVDTCISLKEWTTVNLRWRCQENVLWHQSAAFGCSRFWPFFFLNTSRKH